jgi:hypothetical protein
MPMTRRHDGPLTWDTLSPWNAGSALLEREMNRNGGVGIIGVIVIVVVILFLVGVIKV